MALTLNLWTSFNKRIDSTYRPASSPTYTKTVKLKGATSLENPVFLLDGTISNTVTYAQWMGNYYFVDDIISVNENLWELHCSMDGLATHKGLIGNTVANIAYSSTGYDTSIPDTRIALKTSKHISSASGNVGILDGLGCYILTVANLQGGSTGFCAQYSMDNTMMRNLANFLMTDSGLLTALEKRFKSVFDSVISCIWIPMSQAMAASHASSEYIYLGNVNTNVASYRITYGIVQGSVTVNIPWYYSDFRRAEPYTTIQCFIPGYGIIALNASDLIDVSSLKFTFTIDVLSGDCVCVITKGTSSNTIQTLNYSIATSVPVAQISSNVAGTITGGIATVGSAAGAIAGAATGNVPVALGGIMGTIASGNSMIQSAASRSVSTKGTQGSRVMSNIGLDVIIWTYSIETEDPNNANYIATVGRPVGKKETIGSHSGYVQTVDASVAIAGTRAEAEKINAQLNAGIYYE